MIKVDRQQVLAYRAAAHGLSRETATPTELEIFDLGVQDSQFGSARLALAARLPFVPAGDKDPMRDESSFALLWSIRGAPHLHRRSDLSWLPAALWPLNDDDALTRMTVAKAAIQGAGIDGLVAFTEAARAMRAVVTKPLPKGDVSAAVTKRLPAAYSYACRSCQATHVYGSIFQLVGLPAGVRLVPDSSPLTLVPLEKRVAIPRRAAGIERVITAYLRLFGPATPREVGAYLGTTGGQVRKVWPADLAEVSFDGRRCWLPEEHLDALQTAEPPRYVRLLPALDPWLQARDRDVIVPDREHQKALWRILGNPGGLFVDGEVVGTWRVRVASRKSGMDRLALAVEPFGKLSRSVRNAIDEEAARIVELRGAADIDVTYTS